MILYLLKFTLLLFVFYIFYKLVLERENMHVFKRYYLLFSIVFSLGIPYIVFTQYIDSGLSVPIHVKPKFTATLNHALPLDINVNQPFEKTYIVGQLLWIIYALGVLLFGFRFIKNLSKIYANIKRNIGIKSGQYYHVLIEDLAIPHTFLNYIFLNKKRYEMKLIPEEVLLHEQAHVEQKHSIDILFIEIFQVILWFHPLFYFINRSIKLNHEFLADSSVLNKGFNRVEYQQILLNFSTRAITNQLSNAINYASLKKRFTLMKTQTSQRMIWIKSFILLPLLAVLIYGFSTTALVQEKIDESKLPYDANSNDYIAIKEIKIKINKEKQIFLGRKKSVKLENLAYEIRKIAKNESSKQLEKVKIVMEVQGNLPVGFITDIKIELRKTGLNLVEIVSNGLVKREYLNQQKATPEQLIVYNKLAKKYNMQSKDRRIIRFDELKRLEYIYGLMTEDQMRDAEAFPEYPPLPPAPIAPNRNDLKIKQVSNDSILPIPPEPPISPLDHVIEMAKRGAVFYFDGKKISSDKAIEILKNNEGINISTKGINSKKPIVNLLSKPIKT